MFNSSNIQMAISNFHTLLTEPNVVADSTGRLSATAGWTVRLVRWVLPKDGAVLEELYLDQAIRRTFTVLHQLPSMIRQPSRQCLNERQDLYAAFKALKKIENQRLPISERVQQILTSAGVEQPLFTDGISLEQARRMLNLNVGKPVQAKFSSMICDALSPFLTHQDAAVLSSLGRQRQSIDSMRCRMIMSVPGSVFSTRLILARDLPQTSTAVARLAVQRLRHLPEPAVARPTERAFAVEALHRCLRLPNNRWLTVAKESGNFQIWSQGEIVKDVPVADGEILAITKLSGGRLAVLSRTHGWQVWSEDGNLLHTLVPADLIEFEPSFKYEFIPHLSYCEQQDGVYTIGLMRNDRKVFRITDLIAAVETNPCISNILYLSDAVTVYWDAYSISVTICLRGSTTELAKMETEKRVELVTFFPPEGRLIFKVEDRLIIWNFRNNREVSISLIDRLDIKKIIPLTDQLFATVHSDNTVRIWSSEGQLSVEFSVQQASPIVWVEATRDRRILLTFRDGSQQILDLNVAALLPSEPSVSEEKKVMA